MYKNQLTVTNFWHFIKRKALLFDKLFLPSLASVIDIEDHDFENIVHIT